MMTTRIAERINSESGLFLHFQYPEVKDLLKHFLTLISATLVFSVTFSYKIVDFENSTLRLKIIVLVAWLALVLALGACGLGIYTLYLAAERAALEYHLGRSIGFDKLANRSYFYQDVAGLLFGIGLVILVAAGVVKLLS